MEESNSNEFYLGVADASDKYECFLSWCSSEGVIMPKLEFPAYFEGGLLGTRVTQDIQHREAYLFVPYKMLLSVKNTLAH